MAWWCSGMRWRVAASPADGGGAPVLRWVGDGQRERESPLVLGCDIAIRAVGERRCLGVWRGGAWRVCAGRAVVSERVGRAQCAECARMDRAHSVAADTVADDPRPYFVYLAYFGPGLLKVGITGVARGSARLLEQGAVTFSWLGRGPLMAARRAEELLRTALGVPDRIPYERKRAVRGSLPDAEERAAGLGLLHARAVALQGWPESLERMPFEPVDHGDVFRLGPTVAPRAVVTALGDGVVVAGRLLCAAGPDLHLSAGVSTLVVDTRLMAGWQLLASPGDALTTAAVRELPDPAPPVQDGLF
ncbi:DUF2797 domain-containing protein [Streptomyces tsukubensis]|uniref:DUF2797 domain-containing protein n=1 Tax=Streptomyces tsukubensis TaxID=83656 RepID=A0A1V4A945_9ACTN|nr:DUF2797 domain-containing protein [Streptomyces tsukubensis]OON79185.1 hypothetical protein B1H18_14525 [Streptomyces tsukubensis]QFR94702.1 DUF2797 domain-containing protein [Streptomyces tsukubensis]